MAIKEVTRVQTDREKCRDSALTQLEWAHDQVKSNGGMAVIGIIEYTGGSYRSFGSTTMSRLQTAGALLELAVERLGKDK